MKLEEGWRSGGGWKGWSGGVGRGVAFGERSGRWCKRGRREVVGRGDEGSEMCL